MSETAEALDTIVAALELAGETLLDAQAEIAALRAELARVKLDGVRAGIEAAKDALKTANGVSKAALWDVNHVLGTLDAEAIAKGEG